MLRDVLELEAWWKEGWAHVWTLGSAVAIVAVAVTSWEPVLLMSCRLDSMYGCVAFLVVLKTREISLKWIWACVNTYIGDACLKIKSRLAKLFQVTES